MKSGGLGSGKKRRLVELRRSLDWPRFKKGKLGKKLFTIDEGSDGMAVDVNGNLYLTHGQVQVYDADGKKLETIEVPEKPAKKSTKAKAAADAEAESGEKPGASDNTEEKN